MHNYIKYNEVMETCVLIIHIVTPPSLLGIPNHSITPLSQTFLTPRTLIIHLSLSQLSRDPPIWRMQRSKTLQIPHYQYSKKLIIGSNNIHLKNSSIKGQWKINIP